MCTCVEAYCDIPSIAFNRDFPLDLLSSLGSMSMEREYCCSSSKVVAASKALSKYASTWNGSIEEGKESLDDLRVTTSMEVTEGVDMCILVAPKSPQAVKIVLDTPTTTVEALKVYKMPTKFHLDQLAYSSIWVYVVLRVLEPSHFFNNSCKLEGER